MQARVDPHIKDCQLPPSQRPNRPKFALLPCVLLSSYLQVIGKGGETIHRLIEQARCHIQVGQGYSLVSRDSSLICFHCCFAVSTDNGGVERNITLTGTPENIECVVRLFSSCVMLACLVRLRR